MGNLLTELRGRNKQKRQGTEKGSVFSEQVTDPFDAAPFTEARVDREASTIENVALGGLVSLNGYNYAARAYQEAIDGGKYVGVPVFVDHAQDKARPRGRTLRDLFGEVVSATWDSETNQPRGTIRMTNPANAWVLDVAESNQSKVGMSHVVFAEWSKAGKKEDKPTATKLQEFVSIDIVPFPATTNTFSENREDPAEEMVHSHISGSYESIAAALQKQAKSHFIKSDIVSADVYAYCYVEGTFGDHVIVSCRADGAEEKMYRVSWKMEENTPKLDGMPAEVQVTAVVSDSSAGSPDKPGTEIMAEQTTETAIVVVDEMSTNMKCPHCSKKISFEMSKAEQNLIDERDKLRADLAESTKALDAKDAELVAEKEAHAESQKDAAKWQLHVEQTERLTLAKERIEAAGIKDVDSFVTDRFQKQLMACESAELMDEIIADRKELVDSYRHSKPRATSTQRTAPPTAEQEAEANKPDTNLVAAAFAGF